MYEINNQIKINAPVDQVWQVLTAVDRFHEWNPVIRRVEGPLTVGETVRMTANSPDGEQQWTCRISRHQDGREFAWRFTDRHPLLYRGEHTFCHRHQRALHPLHPCRNLPWAAHPRPPPSSRHPDQSGHSSHGRRPQAARRS